MTHTWTALCRWANRPIRAVAAAALVLCALAPSSPNTAAAASPSIYWGAYVTDAQADPSILDSYEARAGNKVSIVHWGQAWQSGSNFGSFQTQYFQNVRGKGSIPMLTWGSWRLGSGPDQPNFRLSAIADGAYDAYITQWAQDASSWGQPFFLRFDHEMNGDWQFPWAERLNGNQPGDYVRAWRHVHDLFTQAGASNATWVWCPSAADATTTPLAELYPGDTYVDWTCMDGYNYGTGTGDVWQTFGQVFSGFTYGGYDGLDAYQETLRVAPSKPMMLGEVSSTETGGSKANWIEDMLNVQLPTNFPQIKAVVWTEENFDNANWMITSSSSAQAAFKSGISTGYYASNTFGSLGPGAIQPPGTPPQPVPGKMTLNPVADTYTASSSPGSTGGGSSQTLRTDLVGTDTTFLRFDLSSLSGKTITSATLRLHSSTEAWAGSVATFDVSLTDSTDWQELWMSYANTVPVSGTVVGTLVAPRKPNTWYAVTLDAAALQPQTGQGLSVALTGRTGDVFIVNSREAGPGLTPQLIVTFK